MNINNTAIGVALSLLIVLMQACTTSREYPTKIGEQPLTERTAYFSPLAGKQLGKARRVELISINEEGIDIYNNKEITIPSGEESKIKFLVEWSNGFEQEGEIAFEAKPDATYKLSVYELDETEREDLSKRASSANDTFGGAMAEGMGMGLIIALSPLIVVTSPVWYPVGKALEGDSSKLPFSSCCFAWIEVDDGQVESGAKPQKLVKYERLEVLAEKGGPKEQYNLFKLDPSYETLIWLCRAADQGLPDAREELGWLYFNGSATHAGFDDYIISADLTRACLWLHLAGEIVITGQKHRTDILEDSVPYDTNELIRTEKAMTEDELQKAKELISAWEPGQCCRDISMYLVNNCTNNTDISKLCKLADQGDFSARDRLGQIYFLGSRNRPTDLPRSYMWYHLAAKVYEPALSTGEGTQEACDAMAPEQHDTVVKLLEEWEPGWCERNLP